MNVTRIELMIKMLEEVQANTWVGVKRRNFNLIDLQKIAKDENLTDTFDLTHWVAKNTNSPCGFSACAIGHATLDKRFRKMGFTTDCFGIPSFKDKLSRGAVRKFFNISEEILSILYVEGFYPDFEDNRKILTQVIRRHKLLLELGEEKFMKKFNNGYTQERLISPQGRIYNRKLQ